VREHGDTRPTNTSVITPTQITGDVERPAERFLHRAARRRGRLRADHDDRARGADDQAEQEDLPGAGGAGGADRRPAAEPGGASRDGHHAAVGDERAARGLVELHETLRRACAVVESCRRGGYVRGLCAGGSRATSLRDLQSRIAFFLQLFPIISHLDSTRLLVQVIDSAAARAPTAGGVCN
jgi:hypothetical protein